MPKGDAFALDLARKALAPGIAIGGIRASGRNSIARDSASDSGACARMLPHAISSRLEKAEHTLGQHGHVANHSCRRRWSPARRRACPASPWACRGKIIRRIAR